MKKLSIIVVLISLAVLFLPACATTNPDEIQASLNTNFTLPAGKSAALKGTDITFKFDAVTGDSRCPTGVQCIQAGDAKCRLLVTQKGQTQELILTQLGSSENNVQDFVEGYKVSFQLNPYPKAGSQINPQDYVLTMKIYSADRAEVRLT